MQIWRLPILGCASGVLLLNSCINCANVKPPVDSPLAAFLGKLSCCAVRTGGMGDLKNYTWTQGELDWRFASSETFTETHHVALEGADGPRYKDMPVKVRIHHPRQGWNRRILWYFHGTCAKGDFTDDLSGEETRTIFDGFKQGKPIVITIGIGNMRLLDPDGIESYLRTMERALVTVVPDVDKRRAVKHWALGISMGGLNALQILTEPQSPLAFERAVVIAPYIPRCDPFDALNCNACLAAKDCHGKGRGERKLRLKMSLIGIRRHFSEAQWREKNPIAMAKRGAFRNWRDRLLLVWGTGDQFGFDVSSKDLFEAGAFTEKITGCWSHRMPDEPSRLLEIPAFLEAGRGAGCPGKPGLRLGVTARILSGGLAASGSHAGAGNGFAAASE